MHTVGSNYDQVFCYFSEIEQLFFNCTFAIGNVTLIVRVYNLRNFHGAYRQIGMNLLIHQLKVLS